MEVDNIVKRILPDSSSRTGLEYALIGSENNFKSELGAHFMIQLSHGMARPTAKGIVTSSLHDCQ